MLSVLRVRNFAIIDELEVELGPGMNVVTGETGAGKSILIDALSLVLGQRAHPEVVRTGEEQAEVEALFDVSDDPDARKRVQEAGVEVEDELVLRRIVARGGRSRAYVNGRLASAAQLADLAAGLADISSQHEHHTLVDPRTHLGYLDAFAKLEPLRGELAAAHAQVLETTRALDAERGRGDDRVQREDLLRFQITEIDALGPEPGEDVSLAAERDKQRHAEKLAQITGGAEDALYASDDALCERLGRVCTELAHAAAIDTSLVPLAEQLQGCRSQLEDIARELGSYARGVHHDAERLRELEERLDALRKLIRKHGGSVEAVLEYRARAQAELDAIDRRDETLAALERTHAQALEGAATLARKLSQNRKKAAGKLASAISKELASLSMGDARITVEVAQPQGGDPSVDGAQLTATGIDRVEFLIAPNRGEEPQPLRRIASGGELSRAMLALKRVLAGLGPAGLNVLDEVDAGVGGAIAEVIGRKLEEVAAHHQVICITHLPQIAVFAKTHFNVRKAVEGGRTRSVIEKLSATEREQEIARMLGGVKITEKTKAAAREMLKSANSVEP